MSNSSIALPLQNCAALPAVANEPARAFAPGSAERDAITATLESLSTGAADLPLTIAGREIRTGNFMPAILPHRHAQVLAQAHTAGPEEVEAAIAAALEARWFWSRTPWTERAAIFLKAADLAAGSWRNTLVAATMLNQSKTVQQAEGDIAALIDFLRFNCEFMHRIHQEQPFSTAGAWNQIDYRPLEGFVFAVAPFNFTALTTNLAVAPALMGNTVVLKPSATAMFSTGLVMNLLTAAGLPDGVINLINGDGVAIGAQVLAHPSLAGVHFTGSTTVFNAIVRTVGSRIDAYRGYPRLVGETGGKNFVLAHASADLDGLATGIIRGAFEYQGQKCSAASRVFIPESLWPRLRERLCDEMGTIRVGDVADFGNFMGAVIDEKSWRRQTTAIAYANTQPGTRVVSGGTADMAQGYFVAPTLVQTDDWSSPLLRDEYFGPIVTVAVYDDTRFAETIRAIDEGSEYGLTGSIFATDRRAIAQASDGLRDAAGNFYVNDKPSGSMVGQQPFGGARGSGTNDKAGSAMNLMRWVSPRTIKETFAPPSAYRYPYQG